jgi:hypothetical protein
LLVILNTLWMSLSLRTRKMFRAVNCKIQPPCKRPYSPAIRKRQDALLQDGYVSENQVVNILHEKCNRQIPTIVLGGFVPDATEQVFLLRNYFLKHGSIYYFNYPRSGFSIDMIFAQLDDLIEELAALHGQRPVIFSVSFSAGLVMEWLKRGRKEGRSVDLNGIILISPITCVEDLLDPADTKPATLLGRALKPYVDPHVPADHTTIERSRAFFTKMFESGAQNKNMLRMLMTSKELYQLRSAVMNTIRSVDVTGAFERVQAVKQIESPATYFSQNLLPLSEAPTLILYSEKETSVIVENSPTRSLLESNHRAFFPQSEHKIIMSKNGAPVQHASLIFHYFKFLPAISDFYRNLKQ